MDEHFKYESSDRLMLLHAWRTLDKILEDKSPYSNKFFRTLMCVVITKAKSSLASSSRGSSISSTKSDSEALQSGECCKNMTYKLVCLFSVFYSIHTLVPVHTLNAFSKDAPLARLSLLIYMKFVVFQCLFNFHCYSMT